MRQLGLIIVIAALFGTFTGSAYGGKSAHLRADGVLLGWGYVDYGADGIAVEETFKLEPLKWKWTGSAWVAHIEPPPPDVYALLKAAIDDALADATIPAKIKTILQRWRERLP